MSVAAPALGLLAAAGLAGVGGCRETGTGAHMETRIYHLRTDDEARLLNDVLERDYTEHDVRSSTYVDPAGNIVVQAPARAHERLRKTLQEVR